MARTQLTPPDDREVFVVPLDVRPEHIDDNGHVNNVVYVGWLQQVGTAHWNARFDEATRTKWSWVALRHEIDYLRPVDYQPAPVRIDTWVVEVRNVSFTVGYEMFTHDGGEIAARAQTRMVPFDLAAGRPRRLTPVEKTFLNAWHLDAPDDAAAVYAEKARAIVAAATAPGAPE